MQSGDSTKEENEEKVDAERSAGGGERKKLAPQFPVLPTHLFYKMPGLGIKKPGRKPVYPPPPKKRKQVPQKNIF